MTASAQFGIMQYSAADANFWALRAQRPYTGVQHGKRAEVL